MVYRQTSYSPPPGRPGWAGSGKNELDLLYLAWGWRRYNKTPQPAMRREGWLYFAVLGGCPTLFMPDCRVRHVPLEKNDFVILHPDCNCGFLDEPRQKAEIFTWVWRSPSRWGALQALPADFLRFHLDDETMLAIRSLHQQIRGEIQYPDAHTPSAIEALHLQTDIALVRSLSPRRLSISDEQRIALACRWIEEHIGKHQPVSGLCDYLQISPITLNRIFRRHLKINVRTYATHRRLLRATHLIKREKRSVKETSLMLGYRFPNDLSRALRGLK